MRNLVLLFVFMGLGAQAQKLWRAKLFLHFLDTNNTIVTDTVWIGLDSLGDEGYQAGLDVFDTVVRKNKVLGFDPKVQQDFQTGCVNLKTSIKKFVINNHVDFNFYAFGKLKSISWDTTDFMYPFASSVDSTYKFRTIRIFSSNAFLFAIDRYDVPIYNYYNGPNKEFASHDSIMVTNDGRIATECNFPIETTKFNLRVAMGNFNVGFNKIIDNMYSSVNPNPFQNQLFINVKIKTTVKIFDHAGIIHYEQKLSEGENQINVNSLPLGIYYLMLFEKEKITTHKIVKL